MIYDCCFMSQAIQNLHITLGRSLSNDFLGTYKSFVKWDGIEFADVRAWREWDERKRVDPKTSAKKQSNRVREYEEDKQLSLWFVESFQDKSKQKIADQIKYALGYAAIKNNDKIGLIDWAKTIPLTGNASWLLQMIPKKSSYWSIGSLMKYVFLWGAQVDDASILKKKLTQCVHMKINGALLVVITDSINIDSHILKQLSTHNEILWIHVMHDSEINLSWDASFIRFTHEKSSTLVSTKDTKTTAAYTDQVNEMLSKTKKSIQTVWWRYLLINSWVDVVMALQKFFSFRK